MTLMDCVDFSSVKNTAKGRRGSAVCLVTFHTGSESIA